MTDATISISDISGQPARLDDLSAALRRARFVLPTDDRDLWRDERTELLVLIEDYVLPRIAERGGPLTVVVFGPSGSGKSTIVNSLAQRPVGRPGPVRPSTTRAAVWAHRDHSGTYWQRLTTQLRGSLGPSLDTVVSDDAVVRNATIIDAPPLDVRGERGRPAVQELLAIADAAVFVVSAGRYADADTWMQVGLAAERGLDLLFVLNRLPTSADAERLVLDDYRSRLVAEGLMDSADRSRLFGVAEQQVDPDHRGLPAAGIAALRRRLTAGRGRSEEAVGATLAAVVRRSESLSEGLGAQATVARELRSAVGGAYGRTGDRFQTQVRTATLPLQQATDWEAARSDLTRAVTRAAGAAAQEVAAAWYEHPVGRRLLSGDGQSLWRHGTATEQAAVEHLEDWNDLIGAVARGRYPRWWSARKRRRLAAAAGVAALHDSDGDDDGFQELAGDRAADIVDALRAELSSALRAALADDAKRFEDATVDPETAADWESSVSEAVRAIETALGS